MKYSVMSTPWDASPPVSAPVCWVWFGYCKKFCLTTSKAKTCPIFSRRCAVSPNHLRSDIWFSYTCNIPKRWKNKKTWSYFRI